MLRNLKSELKPEDNSCSISSDIERNLNFLDDLKDELNSHQELNEAKIHFKNLDLNKSNISAAASDSESEHSEQYDEVEEFSKEKNEKFEKNINLNNNFLLPLEPIKDKPTKRMSIESGSLNTHYNSNSQIEKFLKSQKFNNNNNNLLNSNYLDAFDFNNKSNFSSDLMMNSQNSSISPNMSFSPNKNLSLVCSNNGMNNNNNLSNNVILLSQLSPLKNSKDTPAAMVVNNSTSNYTNCNGNLNLNNNF